MKYFSADLIYTNTGDPLQNHVVVTDDVGVIKDVLPSGQVGADVQRIEGAIVPGFVNAHCHLELSHLKGKFSTGTGLIPFINDVIKLREYPDDVIQAAIYKADQEMYDNGIVAVGDISNKLDTAACKNESKVNYYTFVEMFDLLQEEGAQAAYDDYRKVYDGQSDINGNKKSCVPHAPYSVSKNLFQLLNSANPTDSTISIHNQETIHENDLFLSKTGDFLSFFGSLGLSVDHFKPSGQTAIHYYLENIRPSSTGNLFVHNTMTEEEDIAAAHDWSNDSVWVTCPNANLFIENRLPDYRKFINQGAKVGIGTDSLTSNWQLSILEEIKTIRKYQSYIDSRSLFEWSSYHSAKALGYENLGSISVGKAPGLVGIPCKTQGKEVVFEGTTSCDRLI